MTQKYSFERPFRMKILALLLDTRWFLKYGNVLIRPEYFEMEDEESFAKAVLDYHKAYNRCPIDPDDVVVSVGPKYAEFVYDVYDVSEAGELDLARDKAIEFAKEQAIKLALLESVDDVNNGDTTQIIKRFEEASRVGEDIESTGIDPVADIDTWLYDYWSDKVHTGIYHLDQILEGGLGVPELGVVLGPPNRGKSMVLVNIGYGAASIGSGKNVVHFTHEMKVPQVAKRYAARMTFRFPTRDGDLKAYEDTVIEVARRFVPGKIRIIGGTKMTFDEIDMHLDRLADDGYETGLIIDDYADLMVPSKHYSERRFELSSIFEDWRARSEEYNCPVWTATQSSRASLSKEIITMADVSEDIGKAAIADVFVAICQTFDEKQTDRARLFLAKLRDGGTHTPVIGCKWYSDSQAIVSTGYVKYKLKEGEEHDV